MDLRRLAGARSAHRAADRGCDLTGGNHLASPHGLALAQAAARAAEVHLAGLLGAASAGGMADSTNRGAPSIRALGRDEALLTMGPGTPRRRLGRRHSEIVVLLAAHPEGLTGDQLSFGLYGGRLVNPVTLRAEMSRLRNLLGPDLLGSRPYRFKVPPCADFLCTLGALDRGAVRDAAEDYRGPLLPASDAPGIARICNLVESRLRGAVLAGRDPALLEEWTRTPWGGDDLEAWETLSAALPDRSPRRAQIAARIGQLRLDYGLGPDRAQFRVAAGMRATSPVAPRATFAQRIGA